eukprot:gene26916-biopygen17498
MVSAQSQRSAQENYEGYAHGVTDENLGENLVRT